MKDFKITISINWKAIITIGIATAIVFKISGTDILDFLFSIF